MLWRWWRMARRAALVVAIMLSVLAGGGWQRARAQSAPERAAGAALTAGLARALQSFAQQQILTAADGVPNDLFGFSVALSADGATALVGAFVRNSGTGAAYVFTQSGGTWTQQQVLTAGDGAPGDAFGQSVALSADGAVALVGAGGQNNNAGAAYVFTESGGTWTQQQKLSAGDAAANDGFGVPVALSANGTTALIGADGKNDFTGAAYVFTESGGTWTQQQELTAGDGAPGDAFGQSVALSGNGTTALIGADGQNNFTGAAYVFTESGGIWTQQQKLSANDAAANDSFGVPVALSANGTTALIGADGHNNFTGAAYVFTESGGTWTQQQELSANDAAANDLFGFSVALSADGVTALVGAGFSNNGAGAAYVFTQSGGTWTQQQKLTAGDGAPGDYFGGAVALSANGTTALIGAGSKNNNTGAAYVFTTGATQSQPIAVQTGWNLISLPLQPTGTLLASDLLNALLRANPASTLVALYSLSSAGWSPFLIEQAGHPPLGTPFPLAVGTGYLLYSDVQNSYTEQGTVPASGPAWQVNQGWTLVGLSAASPTGVQSNTVLPAVQHSGSGGQLAALFGLTAGAWRPSQIDNAGSFIPSAPFTLQTGQGYLLYSDHAGAVTPGTASGAPGLARRVLPGRPPAPRAAMGGMTLPALPPLPH